MDVFYKLDARQLSIFVTSKTSELVIQSRSITSHYGVAYKFLTSSIFPILSHFNERILPFIELSDAERFVHSCQQRDAKSNGEDSNTGG